MKRQSFGKHDEKMQKELPSVGARIVTRDGQVKILNQEIFTQQLLVEMEDHCRTLIDASEVLTVIK